MPLSPYSSNVSYLATTRSVMTPKSWEIKPQSPSAHGRQMYCEFLSEQDPFPNWVKINITYALQTKQVTVS